MDENISREVCYEDFVMNLITFFCQSFTAKKRFPLQSGTLQKLSASRWKITFKFISEWKREEGKQAYALTQYEKDSVQAIKNVIYWHCITLHDSTRIVHF